LSFRASPSSVSKKYLLIKLKDDVVLTQNVNVGGGEVTHNHDADSEACLNRQILNNSVKMKAMEDLCARPRKLKHKELRSQYLDTVTYKDIRNISRNMHKARSSQLLPLPTDTEETLEALIAVLVLTISTELAC